MPSLYVVGGNSLIERMFRKRGWEVADLPDEADLIQFTGGTDVHPNYYGADSLGEDQDYDWIRDDREKRIFDEFKMKKPMAGICRGGQFLNVMHGGTLVQDCGGHTKDHPIRTKNYEKIWVTSTHHQMMVPTAAASVMAAAVWGTADRMIWWDNASEQFIDLKTTDCFDEVEVLIYRKTQCLCFQPHPEYTHEFSRLTEYYFELIGEIMRGD